MTKNEIYLQKRLKIVLSPGVYSKTENNKNYVATISKNLETLGYIFSEKLFNTLSKCTVSQLESFYKEIVPILKKMKGAHVRHKPMYVNFPTQVMEMSDTELYFNALVHYWSAFLQDVGVTNGTLLPVYEKEERTPLFEGVKYDVIDLGSEADFCNIFTLLISSKTSLSQSDKDILVWFINAYSYDTSSFLNIPLQIPLKENLALLVSETLRIHGKDYPTWLRDVIKTPTDILRIAVAMSGGDVSLAEKTKFRKFSRYERKFFLSHLEMCNTDLAEEMERHRMEWIRFGEILHPGEFSKRYTRAFQAFSVLRADKVVTFNSKVEHSLLFGELESVVSLLSTRPGDFARRLDHILRNSGQKDKDRILKSFIKVAEKVSTPVLLQLYAHFKNRNVGTVRTVFPKGNLAKVQVLPKMNSTLSTAYSSKVSNEIQKILVAKFSTLPSLGKVYIDEKLKGYLVPFAQRSASKALKTIVRGSKVDLDDDNNTIRFFIWWKNGVQRTDLDLSALIVDENFENYTQCAYYSLRGLGYHHSGDITNAPKGASEFIDVDMSSVLSQGYRYIVMCVNSFTSQPYVDLPECFAGWMTRKNPKSGEIFEPKTVKNKVDLTADTVIALPLIIDCLDRKVIWCDLSLKQYPQYSNNVHNNRGNITLLSKSLIELSDKKASLYDLFSMHANARGTKIVDSIEKADTVFSEFEGITPTDSDKIAAEYL